MMMLEFLIVPALIVWAVLSLRGGKLPWAQEETALEILRHRYASGEISQEEFEQARRTLV